MLKIALCDDDPIQRLQIAKLLQVYLEKRPKSPGKISAFASGQELLDAIGDQREDFDLYILDVLMPGLTGIDLGVRLRELGGTGAIIYLTSSSEYALDSFKAHALGYLLKPVDLESLSRELDHALSTIEQKRSACVFVKTKGGVHRLLLDELLYVELHNRMLHYHQFDGSITESLTLRTSFQNAVAPVLADGRFFRCGTSFVVNLHYVRGIEKDSLLLDNGTTVPLPRGMSNEARRRWSSYWRGDPLATFQS